MGGKESILGNFIRMRLKELSKTVTELASEIGADHSTVSSWMAGRRPSDYYLPRLAKALNTPFLKILHMFFEDLGEATDFEEMDVIKIPVLMGAIPCGTPRESLNDYVEDFLTIPAELFGLAPGRRYFAVRASGNSMIGKGIGDKYYIIFSPDVEVKSGDIAIVSISGKVCARVVKHLNGAIVLQAANPLVEPHVVREDEIDEFQILGKVVRVFGDPNSVINDIF
jgi:DNA polymerase V